jgi:long-chain acyl-CoA synthetase
MQDHDRLLDLTIPQLLRWRVAKSPEKVALREKAFGIWNPYTWDEYYQRVQEVAAGLECIGFQREMKLALIGDNIPEMLFMAVGAMAVGGVGAGIYQTRLPGEIADILNYLDVRVVFCNDQEQVDKLVEVRRQIPGVMRVIYEDPRGMRSYRADDWFIDFRRLLELGREALAADGRQIEASIDRGRPDDVCFLCLTSGTTGLPKGAMMCHRNYINMGVQITKVDRLAESDEYLSILPFAWIGEQMNSFEVAMDTGITINFPETVETSKEHHKEIWLKIDDAYGRNRACYHYFSRVGQRAAAYRMRGRAMPLGLRFMAWIGDQLVFRPLINQIGFLRLRRAYTGGRPWDRTWSLSTRPWASTSNRSTARPKSPVSLTCTATETSAPTRWANLCRKPSAASATAVKSSPDRPRSARATTSCPTRPRSCWRVDGCIRAMPDSSTATAIWWSSIGSAT